MDYTEALRKIKNPRYYIEHFLTIRKKDQTLSLLKFKPAQNRLYEIMKAEYDAGRPIRLNILKARQLGFSTVIEAVCFQDAATRHLVNTLIVAQDDERATELFEMNKLFYDMLPGPLKPMRAKSNAKELVFRSTAKDPVERQENPGLMSKISCRAASGSNVGRGATITNAHLSEVAFWGNKMKETMTAILQAVPNDINTIVVIETTANGYNEYKQFWDDSVAGKNSFVPVFFPWFEEPDYKMPVVPGTEWTERELSLKKAYNLTDEQLSWRRWCIKANCRGDEEVFKQEYPSCPEEAFITSGNPYFDVAIVLERLNQVPRPLKRGRYEYGTDERDKPVDWRFVECDNGEIEIYQESAERVPFVIGGDTSGDGSDRFTGYLMDNTTGLQAAQLKYDGGSEIYYTQQMYCLGMDYNEALMGVEINFSTYPEKKLEEWSYPNLFIREKPDDSRGKLDSHKLGWRTDSRTRPLILGNMQTVVRENPETFLSADLLREMLTFIRNKDMRPEAAVGEHDDMVMAAAIALHIRYQQDTEMLPEPVEEKQKLIDILQPKRGRI